MPACVCCGHAVHPSAPPRMEGGLVHFECWDEHHSDPTGEWPRGHVCTLSIPSEGEDQ